MGRRAILRILVLVPAAGLWALTPPAARADVLEIDEGSVTWIAGGPHTSDPQPPAQEHSVAMGTLANGAIIPAQYVEAVAALSARYDLSPALIEALVWQESRWRERAISPKGARGLAQLMPATARELGVDPDDPLANLEGGARYLRTQLDRFDGNLEWALAAYNAGPGRVERARGVPRINETRQYVASIMARLSRTVSQTHPDSRIATAFDHKDLKDHELVALAR